MTHDSATLRVGITGHRKLGSSERWVGETLHALLDLLVAHEKVAISALAVGADTLFAETALRLDVPLEAVIPYADYVADFPVGPPREKYEELVERAITVHRLPHVVKSSEAYMSAGKWIVDHCDLLFAVYDGRDPENTGGTADVVQYARDEGTRIVRVDPVARAVSRGKYRT